MSTAISLQGWDTANVVNYEVANVALKASKPTTFDFTDSVTGTRVQGTWGDWVLGSGGQAGVVELNCFISTITVTPPILGNLAGMFLIVKLRLKQKLGPNDAQGKPSTQLVPDTTDSTFTDGTSVPWLMLGENAARFTFPFILRLSQGVFAAFQSGLQANPGWFTTVFHTLFLNQVLDNGDFEWLLPKQASYTVNGVYLDNPAIPGQENIFPDTEKSLFAILAKTDQPASSTLSAQLDSTIFSNLPAGANSVLAISGEQLTRNILLRGAQLTLLGSQLTDFTIAGDGMSVVNNKPLVWQKFKLQDGSEVTPNVPTGGLRLAMVNDHIELTFTGVNFTHPLLVGNQIVTIGYTQKVYLALQAGANGSQVLSTSDKDPNDPQDNGFPKLGAISIGMQLDDAATRFDKAMLGTAIALSIVGLVGGVTCIGGKWALNQATQTIVRETAAADTQMNAIIPPAAAGSVQASGPNVFIGANGAIYSDAGLNNQIAASLQAYEETGDSMAGASTYNQAVLKSQAWLDAEQAVLRNTTVMKIGLGFAIGGIALSIPFWAPYGANTGISLDGSTPPPSLDAFLQKILSHSVWTANQKWELLGMRLAGSLLFYGKLS